ncbi:glucose-6-phosphate isomerase [Treponema sp. OMZ 840]|uniref:glucose-6-phosphate isomerase family protein n=1 Tax=Treponema sp. OMZ 840 TaxID=244313 RepID=UPI003D8D5C56
MTVEPFYTYIDKDTKKLDKANAESVVTLGEMADSFADKNSALAMSDKVVYRVFKRSVDEKAGELLQCTTEILPGLCAGEFFMTRGHGHICKECAEIYLGISGKGLVLMQHDSEFKYEELVPGKAVYIPGGWNHRTVNVCVDESLFFYSVWPAQSGYDYSALERIPFLYRVYEEDDAYCLRGTL